MAITGAPAGFTCKSRADGSAKTKLYGVACTRLTPAAMFWWGAGLLQTPLDETSTIDPEVVEKVIMQSEELAKRGIAVPEGILVRRLFVR